MSLEKSHVALKQASPYVTKSGIRYTTYAMGVERLYRAGFGRISRMICISDFIALSM